MKTLFTDKLKFLSKKKETCPHENFNSIDDYQKLVNNLIKEVLFIKLENACPSDEKLKRTKKIIKLFNIKLGEE